MSKEVEEEEEEWGLRVKEKYYPGIGPAALAHVVYYTVLPLSASDPVRAFNLFITLLQSLPEKIRASAEGAMREAWDAAMAAPSGLEYYVLQGLLLPEEEMQFKSENAALQALRAGLRAISNWLYDVMFPRTRRYVATGLE